MNRKIQIICLGILVLLTGIAVSAAIYQQRHRAEIVDSRVVRLTSQRDVLTQTAEGYRLQLNTATNQVKILSEQKAGLCAQLTAAKLKNPVCP